jgi:predicted RNase H-like nuclease (RuvC/YqgF family)
MEKAKTLIVEHPFEQGWKLTSVEKPIETTEVLYRFKTTVPAGKSATVTVSQELQEASQIVILSMDDNALLYYSKNGEISKAVRDALQPAILLRQQTSDAVRLEAQYHNEINGITQEQVRLRDNLKAVPDKSTLQTRYLEKLEAQEKQIDDLYKKMEEARKLHERLRKELEEYLNGLNVEG